MTRLAASMVPWWFWVSLAGAGFVERDRRVPPEMSCDGVRVATLSWRRFRTRFGLYVQGTLPQKQRWQLTQDAQFLARNASYGRSREHFSRLLKFLSGSLPSFPDEICFFGEVAAFTVIFIEKKGHWETWHQQVIREVEFVGWMARDSGWPLWTGTQLGLLGVAKPLTPQFSMDYASVLALHPPPTAATRASREPRRPLRVAIVGGHSSQLLQSAGMLQQLISPLEVHYAGCGYREPICVEIGSDPNSELAQGIWYADKLRIQRGMREEKIPNYELVLVIDVGLSLLLRQLSEEVPILHVIGIYPLTELAADIAEELLLSVQHPKTYAVATSGICALHLSWITGLNVPVISPLPYPPAIYGPNSTLNMASYRRSILQWRGDVLWNTIAGSTFFVWLQHLFHRSAAIDILRMTGAMSWQEVSQHHAVLFVPEDLTKIAFWDLYAAGMPMFVPDVQLLSMLLCFEEKSVDKMHFFDPRARQHFHGSGSFEALEPFDLRVHCQKKMELWAPFADCYQFPHVQVFSSSLQLLEWLKQQDLGRLSRRMRRHAGQKRRLAQQHFAWAVQQVFDVNGSWGGNLAPI